MNDSVASGPPVGSDVGVLRYQTPNIHPSVIQIRLETESQLKLFELLLRGEVIEEKIMDDGRKIQIHVRRGEPLLTEEVGVQSVMRWARSCLNPQVVQGNYDVTLFENEIYRIHVGFARDIVLNYVKWGLKKEDRDHLVELFLDFVNPYLSRLIDNKERESYSQSLRGEDRTVIQRKDGGFMGIFR